jgi:hypothetical protein
MYAYPEVSAQQLDPDHYDALTKAIRQVLSTDLAVLTMAQLVDGLPTAAVGWDVQGTLLLSEHPLNDHKELCDGAMEQTRKFRDSFGPSILKFYPKVSLLLGLHCLVQRAH